MPKPVKKPAKKAAQANLAEHMSRAETDEKPWDGLPSDDGDTRAIISAYMRVLGTRGGKVSGAKRMENLSDKKRKEIAQQAAKARWEGRK